MAALTANAIEVITSKLERTGDVAEMIREPAEDSGEEGVIISGGTDRIITIELHYSVRLID